MADPVYRSAVQGLIKPLTTSIDLFRRAHRGCAALAPVRSSAA